jgi:hypothetical protein
MEATCSSEMSGCLYAAQRYNRGGEYEVLTAHRENRNSCLPAPVQTTEY